MHGVYRKMTDGCSRELRATMTEVLRLCVPFLAAQSLYWLHFFTSRRPPHLEYHGDPATAVLIKCLPILALIGFTFSYRSRVGGGQQQGFRRKIQAGLVFSVVGDACLVFPDLFLHGMVAFGLAHLCYISAFGLKQIRAAILLSLMVCHMLINVIILPTLPTRELQIGVPVYGLLLITTASSALSRARTSSPIRILTAVSCLLFVISDGLIVISMFYWPMSYAELGIMSTYYAAQFGITLSVTEPDKTRSR